MESFSNRNKIIKKKTRKTEFLKEVASSPPKILSLERWIDREGTVQDANDEVERPEQEHHRKMRS
jgi:hypothetical protein